jgi:hypothetical protein
VDKFSDYSRNGLMGLWFWIGQKPRRELLHPPPVSSPLESIIGWRKV